MRGSEAKEKGPASWPWGPSHAQGISHTSQQGHNLQTVQLVTENGSDVPHTTCSATLSSLQGLFNKRLLQVC